VEGLLSSLGETGGGGGVLVYMPHWLLGTTGSSLVHTQEGKRRDLSLKQKKKENTRFEKKKKKKSKGGHKLLNCEYTDLSYFPWGGGERGGG